MFPSFRIILMVYDNLFKFSDGKTCIFISETFKNQMVHVLRNMASPKYKEQLRKEIDLERVSFSDLMFDL